jgi:hypothetical protein
MSRPTAPLLLLLAALSIAPAALGRAPRVADAETAARGYAARNGRALGLVGGVSLGRAQTIGHLGQRVVLFDLRVAGLKVFFRKAALQVDADGNVRRVSVDAPLPPADPAPRDVAREIAEVTARAEADGLAPRGASAGWLVGFGGALRPVVRAEGGGVPSEEPLAVYYDARTLVPLHEEPLYDSASAGGLVFQENPATTPDPKPVELFGLDESGDLLNGVYAHVARCVDRDECKQWEQTARPNKQGDFVYLPELGADTFDDPFSEVNVYYHLTRFSFWLREALGWQGLFGDHEWIFAAVGMDWYNAAFYSGGDDSDPYIIFGQDVVDMAYDADVVCHEYGHGVNRSLRSHPWYVRDAYGLDTSPQALEEGFADIWTQTFNGDPVMDAYVPLSRNADNDLVCPKDVEGEGHYEARIVSGFGWDVRTRIGAAAWNHVIFRTLPFLAAEAGFDDLVTSLAESAADLAAEGSGMVAPGDADIIVEEGAKRGFLDPACNERLVPLADGEAKEIYGFGRSRTGKRDRPFGAQWVLTAGPGDAAFHLAIDPVRPEGVEFGYRVHISRGDPVAVTWLDPDAVPEGEPEFTVDADRTIEGAPRYVDFPTAGEAPLSPGEPVYVLLSADMDPQTMVLRGTPLFLPSLPPAPADAGPGAEASVAAHAPPWGNGCAALPARTDARGILSALFR